MKGKKRKKSKLHLAVAAAILAGVCGFTPKAQAAPEVGALPVGGISSSASITTSGNTMTINGSANNLITWQSFSVGANAKVNFDANNYLNYVRGNNLSEIYGTITGKGAIYLVNPNGITIDNGASIDVGTLNISTADLGGKLNSYATALAGLQASGLTYEGDIINKGTLKAANSVIVEGDNITFKNVDNVKAGTSLKVTATSSDAFHVGRTNDNNLTLTTDSTTPTYYKLVSTAEELQNIDPNGNSMLANDIDASSINNFKPIGRGWASGYHPNRFTGRFDGLNYVIKNLTVSNAVDGAIGLFTAVSGIVENVGIVNGKPTPGLTAIRGLNLSIPISRVTTS